MSRFNIESFKSQVSIIRVLENYLVLRKEGAYFKALCPFHHEKTPSFIIDENKGFYHCFGCNESGDAIKFVQKFKNLDFFAAVEEIARLEHIELSFNEQSNAYFQNLEFLKQLNEFFKTHLKQNEKAKMYFSNRGIDEEDIEHFSLGYVPKKEEFLRFIDSLNARKKAYELGLVSEKEGVIFANRLSFALKDAYGKVRGFSTRELIKNPHLAKYINSKNSNTFNKSFILYNLCNAKTPAYREKELFIMEGFFDVIAAYKCGLKNAVATCGTAFTTSHLALIFKHIKTSELTLCFVPDKDAPGYKSVIRSLKLCFEQNFFNVKVALLMEKCKDLGEFYQLKGICDLKEHFTFYSGFEFYLRYHLKRLKNAVQKDNFLKEIITLIKNIKQYFIKEQCIQEACAVFGVNANVFNAKIIDKNTALNEDFNVKTCLKTALNNEEFKQRFNFFVSAEFLGEFAQSYKDFLQSSQMDAKLLELCADESINILKPAYFSLALKNLVKTHYLKALMQAKKAKDFQKTMQMSQKIAELSKPF
ncbi:DNA primase [Campylobacter cuniculorum]|uniref:DNA primase n=2 Tax=Campylobacter cuniculorum TaxID=374106 RepID=A0A1W6BV19_9BACT|nr:DNA primase [Campylobacter cuniculorum]ARJ55940.1 DNA primase [Campylobacter cuniculorum DSM 23162 = LMG 24588]QOR05158.1 DNA primase [Campylobacter cuniculorum]